MVRKESDVSIGTQPEGERMQRHRVIEDLNNSMLKYKGIMISRPGSGCNYPYTNLSVAGGCKGDEHIGSREFIGEQSSESSGEASDHLG